MLLRGKEVANSPFALTVVPSDPHAPSSGPSGPLEAGEAGKDGHFTIFTRDAQGNPLRSGGARLVVQLECEGRVQQAGVSDREDGSYAVRYRAERAVVHLVHAWLVEGEAAAEYVPLANTPWKLSISAGPVCAAVSNVSGGGCGSVVAGEVAEARVQLRDSYGNPRAFKGERIVAMFERPAKQPVCGVSRFSAKKPALHAAELEAARADSSRRTAHEGSQLPVATLLPTERGGLAVQYQPVRAEHLLLHMCVQQEGQDAELGDTPFHVEVVPGPVAAHRTSAATVCCLPVLF